MDEKGAPPPAYEPPAGAPPQGYPPQGPPPQGYPPQGPPPQGYPPQGPPPQGYPPQGPPPQGYPPQGAPPQGYPQGPPPQGYPQQQVVVVQGGAPMLSDRPCQIVCPQCQANVMTTCTYELGTLTWLIVGALFIVGLWLCCCIPCCIDDCKDVVHHCPNCNRVVGTKRRI